MGDDDKSETLKLEIVENDNINGYGDQNLDGKRRDEPELIEIEIPLELAEFLESEGTDIDKFCRVCMNVELNMTSIFTVETNEPLAEMLSSFTSFQVLPDDGLPTRVCLNCSENVRRCFSFKQQCDRSDTALRAFLKGELVYNIKTQNDEINETGEAEPFDTDIKIESVPFCEPDSDCSKLKTEEDSNSCCIIKQENGENCSLPSIEVPQKRLHRIFCDFCKKEFSDTVKLARHMKYHMPKKQYPCKLCKKSFNKSKSLKAHLKSWHDVQGPARAFPCQLCKMSFTSENDLDIHSYLHPDNGKWFCNKCEKDFTSRSQLQRHLHRHMEEKRYKCDVCQKSFSEHYALRRHTRKHTGEAVERKHICSVCGKRFLESSAMKIHMRQHTGERPCVCAVCGKAFRSTRLLNSHARTHDQNKPHECRFCDKRFRHESTLMTHHRTHTGEKPYICATCGKSFIQSSNLTLHMRTHSGEKPYSCSTCPRSFSSWSTLKCHERTHTGEKPYSCKVCNKRFARLDMTAHMRVHSGERPFACSICPKHFTSNTRLREHSRVHTGEKPFQCAVCNLKYGTKSHLLKHFKTHRQGKHWDLKMLIEGTTDAASNNIMLQKLVYLEKDDCVEESVETSGVEVDTPENFIQEVELTPTNNESPSKEKHEPIEDNESFSPQNNDEYSEKKEIVIVEEELKKSLESSGVNVVAVGEEEEAVSISTTSAVGLEGTGLKLYQLDQSTLRIHSVGGQLTISKITSKMTANFE